MHYDGKGKHDIVDGSNMRVKIRWSYY